MTEKKRKMNNFLIKKKMVLLPLRSTKKKE